MLQSFQILSVNVRIRTDSTAVAPVLNHRRLNNVA